MSEITEDRIQQRLNEEQDAGARVAQPGAWEGLGWQARRMIARVMAEEIERLREDMRAEMRAAAKGAVTAARVRGPMRYK